MRTLNTWSFTSRVVIDTGIRVDVGLSSDRPRSFTQSVVRNYDTSHSLNIFCLTKDNVVDKGSIATHDLQYICLPILKLNLKKFAKKIVLLVTTKFVVRRNLIKFVTGYRVFPQQFSNDKSTYVWTPYESRCSKRRNPSQAIHYHLDFSPRNLSMLFTRRIRHGG